MVEFSRQNDHQDGGDIVNPHTGKYCVVCLDKEKELSDTYFKKEQAP